MKKYDLLCVNGCSFTYGTGIFPRGEIESLRFSRLLSDELNCEEYNISKAGGSNQRIIRTTFNYLNNFHKDDNILFIIGLTGWARDEVYFNLDEQFYQMYFHPNKIKSKSLFSKRLPFDLYDVTFDEGKRFLEVFCKYFQNEEVFLERHIRELIMLQSHIKQVLPNSDMIVFNSLLYNVSDKMKRNFNWFEFDDAENWIKYCIKNKIKGDNTHPSAEAHKLITKDLKGYIDEKI